MSLQFSALVALIKPRVGGTSDTLISIARRETDVMDFGDQDEIEDARSIIQTFIPQVLPYSMA